MSSTISKAVPAEPGSKAWGTPAKHATRWQARVALAFCIVLQYFLPDTFSVGASYVTPAIEAVLLIALTVLAPMKSMDWRVVRTIAISMIALVNLANVYALVRLVDILLYHGKDVMGNALLLAAGNIWLTNIIVYALWYWELDRGGPDDRMEDDHDAPDFLFPQMATPGCTYEGWSPQFVDYLYVSFTNATAFSPTDTMPLSVWAKGLMLVQAACSLVTIALVAARAVNILA